MSTKYHVFTLMFQCQNTLLIGEFDILINNTYTGLHYVTYINEFGLKCLTDFLAESDRKRGRSGSLRRDSGGDNKKRKTDRGRPSLGSRDRKSR